MKTEKRRQVQKVWKGRSVGSTGSVLAAYDATRCKGSLSAAQLVAIARAGEAR